VNLQAYLDRIGFEGEPRADRATLEAIHRRHLLAIPYENLDVQLGRTLTTSPRAAFDKLANRRRGGWCYEMNGALGLALQTIGFTVTRMAGAVMRPVTGDAHIGSHLVLKVDLPEETMIADVGFGDGPIVPFALRAGPFTAGVFDFALEAVEDGWWRLHNHPLGGAASFDFQPTAAKEAVLTDRCNFLQTSEASPFVQNLVVQIHTDQGLTLLRGRVLRRVDRTGPHDQIIGSPTELVEVLDAEFGLEAPEAAGLWERIARRHDELFGAAASA
jgi:N-hydroxyarylamine O-acetyltransferase